MGRAKTSTDLELLVRLDRDGGEPLHRQLEQELRASVRAGRLAAGAILPSTRALGQQLKLSRGVVVEAYEQLVAEGYLVTRPGGATSVAPCATPSHPPAPAPLPSRPEIAFGYGPPDVTEFPRGEWLRSVRRVLSDAASDRLSHLDDRGVPELRTALAEYLNRVRGTCVHADQIVVVSGFAQGMSLLAQVLRRGQHPRLALEDPSDDTPRRIAEANGLEVVPVPVDEGGILPAALRSTDADAVVVTAAHQFPIGGVLAPDRRADVLRWAAEGDRLVIEDDYDAEYRYDREPIGAMQGLAPDRVAYIGSASKTLAPGLRLGWMVLPPHLVEAVATAKHLADRGSPVLDQLVFADFLARGELDRHLRRMRPIYRRRRDLLLESLATHLPQIRPVGASAGLHVLAWLPPGLDERRLVADARGIGVGLEALAPYRIRPGGAGGIIFGYANVPDSAIVEGIRRLGALVSAPALAVAQ